MKTIEEFYKEIAGSKELQEELKTLTVDSLGEFLKKHGCNATAKEFVEFARLQSEGEIEDDDANTVAGGFTASFGLFGDKGGKFFP